MNISTFIKIVSQRFVRSALFDTFKGTEQISSMADSSK